MKAKIAVFFIILSLAGMISQSFPPFAKARLNVRKIILPLPQAVEAASQKSIEFLTLWSSLSKLVEENKRLAAENIEIKSQLAKMTEFEKENQALRDQLGMAEPIGGRPLAVARVLGGSPQSLFQTITINQGSDANVAVGMPAVYGGFLVGTVSEVAAKTAQIKLITAHNSAIPVVFTQSRAKGLLRGGIKGLVVEDIPIDIKLTPGEIVVSAGLTQDIPAGIAVGQFDSIVSSKGEIFQVAKIASPVELSKLPIVVIVDPK